jgi:hypothetical protein
VWRRYSSKYSPFWVAVFAKSGSLLICCYVISSIATILFNTNMYEYYKFDIQQGFFFVMVAWNTVKPALNGTWIRRKPVFTGKLLQSRRAELQRLNETEPVFRGGNFGPLQFRYRQVSPLSAVVMYNSPPFQVSICNQKWLRRSCDGKLNVFF